MKAPRRFTDHDHPLGKPLTLKPDHPAIVEKRTMFPSTVRGAETDSCVLKSGAHNHKIGGRVTKGRWKGFPIYTLTLEERATCPTTCAQWHNCYGNKMHWSHRWEAGPLLQKRLRSEIWRLSTQHPDGFVVRLHVLGDFYSTDYVNFWRRCLNDFPALHIFGYTAWSPQSTVGRIIHGMSIYLWDRFTVRFSNHGLNKRGAEVVIEVPQMKVDGAIICPAQTGKTDCCGTCTLCWATTRNILFLEH